MLYILFLCAVTSLVSARPKDQQTYRLPSEMILKAQKYVQPCIEEHKADPDVFKKLLDGTISNDEATKNFMYCFCVKVQFTDEEGHFNIDRMAWLLGEHDLKEPFKQALSECNKVTKEKPTETVYAMSMCLNDNSLVAFSL